MGLFNKKQDSQPSMQNNSDIIDGISLLDKLENGYIDDKSFLSSFGKVDVFLLDAFWRL